MSIYFPKLIQFVTSVDPDSVPAIFELVSAILMPYLSGAEWQDEMITVLLGGNSDWAELEAGSVEAGSAFHCSSLVFCCYLAFPCYIAYCQGRLGKHSKSDRFLTDFFVHFP